jgi:hypothetical protein
VTLDAEAMREELKAYVRREGDVAKAHLAKIAKRHGVVGGRPWEKIDVFDLGILFRYSLGGEALVEATPEEAAMDKHCDDLLL